MEGVTYLEGPFACISSTEQFMKIPAKQCKVLVIFCTSLLHRFLDVPEKNFEIIPLTFSGHSSNCGFSIKAQQSVPE